MFGFCPMLAVGQQRWLPAGKYYVFMYDTIHMYPYVCAMFAMLSLSCGHIVAAVLPTFFHNNVPASTIISSMSLYRMDMQVGFLEFIRNGWQVVCVHACVCLHGASVARHRVRWVRGFRRNRRFCLKRAQVTQRLHQLPTCSP